MDHSAEWQLPTERVDKQQMSENDDDDSCDAIFSLRFGDQWQPKYYRGILLRLPGKVNPDYNAHLVYRMP